MRSRRASKTRLSCARVLRLKVSWCIARASVFSSSSPRRAASSWCVVARARSRTKALGELRTASENRFGDGPTTAGFAIAQGALEVGGFVGGVAAIPGGRAALGSLGDSIQGGFNTLADAMPVGLGAGGLRGPALQWGAVGDLEGLGSVSTTTSPFGPVRPGLEIPLGLSGAQFDRISGRVRAAADVMGLGDDIFVMGSRAGGTAKVGSDLDIGIRVTQSQFDDLITSSFANAKNARAATMEVAIRDGRIQAGEAGLSRLGRLVAKDLSFPTNKVKISVIRAGGNFDNGPQSPLAYTLGR